MEADHDAHYHSQVSVVAGRSGSLTAFTPALVAAADSALSWLQSSGAKLPLAFGLPPASFSQWSVHIDPAVGDPFITSWKTRQG